ncbi:MAG: hypothetical protein KDK24_05620 [Pseudooceanicola sp.]|nr:hypothetical protein [Pseudooceanicola sp.]
MSVTAPLLGDLWPYAEAAVAPELAALPVDVFFSSPKGSSIKAAAWTTPADPAAAPRASYALRIRRKGREGDLARWNPARGEWEMTRRFAMPEGDDACAIVEMRGILLGGVTTPEQLGTRMKALMQAELSEGKGYRIAARIASIASIVTLFYSVRHGVESHALEPFALIFALALGIGLTGVWLRVRTKSLSAQGLARIREQFQFEYSKADHAALSLTTVTGILAEHDRKRDEEAVIFGFLLLLCFVYFISPLVVIGVIVALILVTLISGDPSSLRVLGLASDRSEARLEHSALSLRASDDALAPPALRAAKRAVLRDRMRRHGDMLARLRAGQGRFRLTQDIAVGVSFLVIFSAYAFPIAAGLQKLAVTRADSLVNTSLFSVAPVIILLSISRSTVALSQILNRKLAALAK